MPVGYPTNAFFHKGEWYNTDGEGVPATVVTNPLTGVIEIAGAAAAAPVTDQRARYPMGTLSLSLSASAAVPMSIGTDGGVYGSTGLGSKTVARSYDGFVSVESGATLPSVGTIIMCRQTREGYYAITSGESLYGSPGSNTAYSFGSEIWFSTNFASGWSKVADAGRMQGVSVGAVPVYDPDVGGTICLAGEYSNTSGQTHQLWLSTDGGQSWSVILSRPAVDPTKNNHFHGSCYDPITRRIYAAHGDAENAWFGYSADLGLSWVDVPAVGMPPPSITAYHQPVVVAPALAGIVTTPDATDGSAGVWMVSRTGHVNVPTINLPQLPYDQYAEMPVGGDGRNIVYTVHPMRGTRTSNKVYVLATGDGGRTWHTVFEAAQSANEYYERGVVGPDRAGRIYIHCRQDAANKLFVGSALKWRALPDQSVRAASGSFLDALRSASVISPAFSGGVDFGASANLGAGHLSLTATGATLTLGGQTGIAAIDTSPTTDALRILFRGENVCQITGSAGVYGQVEYLRPLTYIKFGSVGGMVPSNPNIKMGLWGATPVTRPTGTPAAATDLATAITLLNDIRAKLIAIGAIS